jgi:hypothetical protein
VTSSVLVESEEPPLEPPLAVDDSAVELLPEELTPAELVPEEPLEEVLLDAELLVEDALDDELLVDELLVEDALDDELLVDELVGVALVDAELTVLVAVLDVPDESEAAGGLSTVSPLQAVLNTTPRVMSRGLRIRKSVLMVCVDEEGSENGGQCNTCGVIPRCVGGIFRSLAKARQVQLFEIQMRGSR